MNSRLLKLKEYVKKLGIIGMLPFVFWPVFFLIVTFFIYRTEYNVSYNNVENETTIKAYNVAESFKDYLNNVTLIVDTASEAIDDMLMQRMPVSEVQLYLERKSQNLASIMSGDTKGIYGYVQGVYVDGDKWVPDDDYVPTERVWYIKAVEADGAKVMIDPYIDARTGKTIVTAAKVLPDKKSVLAIDIWLSRMQEMTEEVGNNSEYNDVMIMDQEGNVIAHSDSDEVGLNYKNSDDAQKRNIYESWQNCNGEVFRVKIDGVDYLLFAKDISNSWTVITVTSARPAMQKIYRLTRNVIISAIIGLFATFYLLLSISGQKIRILSYGENIQSIANIYTSMQKLNLETREREVIAYTKEFEKDYFFGTGQIDELCDERSKEELLKFTDLSTIDERMGMSDAISIEFLNHEHLWYRGRFIAVDRNADGKLRSVIWAVEQIDKEKRSRDKLQYLAETDQLTKINNRGSGENKIRNKLMNGEGGMFILFDVDHFKNINDTLGHGAGDKVLIAIGECMMRVFREQDISLRLGGDEFAAYTPGIFTEEAGRPVIDRLIAAVNRIDIPELNGMKVNISVGAAFYTEDDTFTFEELYKNADSCTYRSKKTDGSHVTFFSE